MRKWYVPLTLFGLGSLGVLIFSERGRQMMRWFAENAHRAPKAFLDWNESAQVELDRIQATLERIAESLEPRGELGQ